RARHEERHREDLRRQQGLPRCARLRADAQPERRALARAARASRGAAERSAASGVVLHFGRLERGEAMMLPKLLSRLRDELGLMGMAAIGLFVGAALFM